MARLAHKTKKFRRKASRSSKYGLEWDSREYMVQAIERMELYDSLTLKERELIDEYGFRMAYPVIRQNYGRWDAAREELERQRKALQSWRMGHIT
jgi:hypothetical protein